jgi:hypothetical protein
MGGGFDWNMQRRLEFTPRFPDRADNVVAMPRQILFHLAPRRRSKREALIPENVIRQIAYRVVATALAFKPSVEGRSGCFASCSCRFGRLLQDIWGVRWPIAVAFLGRRQLIPPGKRRKESLPIFAVFMPTRWMEVVQFPKHVASSAIAPPWLAFHHITMEVIAVSRGGIRPLFHRIGRLNSDAVFGEQRPVCEAMLGRNAVQGFTVRDEEFAAEFFRFATEALELRRGKISSHVLNSAVAVTSMRPHTEPAATLGRSRQDSSLMFHAVDTTSPCGRAGRRSGYVFSIERTGR